MNNKTTILSVLVIFGVIGLLFVLGGRSNQNNQNNQTTGIPQTSKADGAVSSLTAPEKFYDFGTISMKNGNVSKMFKVSNLTDKDIFIPNLTTSCMCTNAYLVQLDGNKKGPFGMTGMGFVPKLNETIKAGESRDIEVVYDPNAHGPAGVGLIDRFVYLADNSNNALQFEIKAKVTP
jgi:hypothetical protein